MSTKFSIVTSAADGCGKPSSIRPMDNSHSSNMERKESFMFSGRSSISRGFSLAAVAAATVGLVVTAATAKAAVIPQAVAAPATYIYSGPYLTAGSTAGLNATVWHFLAPAASSGGFEGILLPESGNSPGIQNLANMESFAATGTLDGGAWSSSTPSQGGYAANQGDTYTLPTDQITSPGQFPTLTATEGQANQEQGGTGYASYFYKFTNTNLSFYYNGGESNSFNSYLGADATGTLAASDTGNNFDVIMDSEGYLSVSQAGTYTFTLHNADDGAAVLLGGNGTPGSGTTIATMGWGGDPSNNNGTDQVTFTRAGTVPFELFWYQGFGGAGLDYYVTAPAGATVSYYTTATPEPATLGLVGIGAMGLLLLKRRKAV
ncbi:MAG: GLEYA domain-containing protein [Phycisphaerae bacterium]